MLLMKSTVRLLRGHPSTGTKLFDKLQLSRKSSSSLSSQENDRSKVPMDLDSAKVRTTVRNMPLKKQKLTPDAEDQDPAKTDPSSGKQCSSASDAQLKETNMSLPRSKPKLNLKSLKTKEKAAEESVPNSPPRKGKLRATVDLEMMKEELKQLEDPPMTPTEKLLSANRLGFPFFDVPCEKLAQNLLGKILVRQLENGTILKGRIVETESYLGGDDKASHSYQNKVTARNIPMYMPPGTIYVYFTYGMYHCFNISSKGEGSAVLLRAVEPIEGAEYMADLRNSKTNSKKPRALKNFKMHELCNGPSKLCLSFSLNRGNNKYSLCESRGMWVENDFEEQESKIVRCPRIGIEGAGPEWAQKPLRFYVYGNRFVSKRDKKAEAAFVES